MKIKAKSKNILFTLNDKLFPLSSINPNLSSYYEFKNIIYKNMIKSKPKIVKILQSHTFELVISQKFALFLF